MLHPAAGSLCRMTEVHRCYWQLIICYTLQKRDSVIDSLRSWRYCVGARLKFSHSNILPTAPPPNLTRLLHNTASYAGYVIDWWAVVYSRTAIVIHPFIIQSFQHISKLETCCFVKFRSLKHLPFRRQFQDLKKRVSSRYSHTDCNSATVAKTSLKNRIRVVWNFMAMNPTRIICQMQASPGLVEELNS